MYKSKIPGGDGYRKGLFRELKERWSKEAKTTHDWDCILSWDATGYAKTMKFNKHHGTLEGFVYDPETFNMHQMFAEKVNCFMVSSPESRIKIEFPIAYYHCSTLNSAVIRQQWFEVMAGLDSVGFNVVSLVCDGASEHFKFFNMVLDQVAREDPSILVRLNNMWVVSDPPHLMKKFRNNWFSSGEYDRHTKRLMIDGKHIGWSFIDATHTASTTLPDGTPRATVSLRKMKYNVVHPTGIQRLRVSLAAIPFSKEVQDFVKVNIRRVAELSRVTEDDVKETLKFCANVNELFQIMNGKRPITWTYDLDQQGNVVGLRDKLPTSRGMTLNWYSDKYGVSVDYLKIVSGLPDGKSVPPHGSELIIDRMQRLLDIADYFKTWKESVDGIAGLTKAQRKKMFLTHWLYTDLRRTCYSVVELMRHYVTKTGRRWVLRRFSQDPIESLFGQIRNLAGSNTNLDRTAVDLGMSEYRCKVIETE